MVERKGEGWWRESVGESKNALNLFLFWVSLPTGLTTPLWEFSIKVPPNRPKNTVHATSTVLGIIQC